MANNVPKPLITDANTPTANQGELDLKAAAQSAADAARKRGRQQANNKLKKDQVTSGALAFAPSLFFYANGRVAWIQVQKATVKKCSIKKPPEETLKAAGDSTTGIIYPKTKQIKISYGYVIKTRKKPLGAKGLKRGGNAGKQQVRSWISISVPADAKFIDCIHYVKSAFGKVPGLMQVGTQQYLFNYDRAMGGAGAAR
jgi:hypothetical protein